MGLRELITDVWSWLDYKPAMADPRRPGRNTWAELTRSWMPDEDLRRLAAYRLGRVRLQPGRPGRRRDGR